MKALPIDPLLPRIVGTLAERPALVLQAPPGAGKTTRVPLALVGAPWMDGRKAVVLEPRRLAARLAARHMAAGLGEAVGGQVGYRVRLDSRVGPETRVELVTDGLFLRRIQADPGLEGIGCLVFDEFHERGLDSDLSLALALEAQALNPDLRLLVMSATLDAAPVARLLGGAPVLSSEGRSFPVEVRWRPENPSPGRRPARLEDRVVAVIREALAAEQGSLLVFLPGQREIRRTAERLAGLPETVEVWPLYGDLAGDRQEAALRPAWEGRRKVVLATAIAETSLTIEGIRVVVDAGLSRVSRFDPRSAMSRLETVPASQATATQRAGRAGRLSPGVCYRLWGENEHRGRPAQSAPEMLQADLAPLALELAVWGAGEGRELAFLDPPPPGPMAQARDLLGELGALEADGRPSDHGRAMAALGLHPRLAHMLLAAKPLGLGRVAAALAALLGGRDPLRGLRDSDLRARLELLLGDRQDARADRAALAEGRALMQQWMRQLGIPKGEPPSLGRAGEALALAYPDRVAKALGQPGLFQLVGGRQAALPAEDPLASEPFLAVAELDGAGERPRIYLALPLAEAALEALFADRIAEREVVAWSQRDEAVLARRERRLGRLLLAERKIERPDPAAVAGALLEGLRRKGIAALPWSESARRLVERVRFLHRVDPADWPDWSEERLLADAEDWLQPHLAGIQRLAALARLDLARLLRERLDWPQRQALDRLAPERLPVPSGREVALDYGGEMPVLAVKLQELYGLAETPRVAGGRVAVTLQLLSPAGRPLQTTQDLGGFWRGSYAAVRAEMRGRYPKHPWPEDPLTAPPQRGTKRSRR